MALSRKRNVKGKVQMRHKETESGSAKVYDLIQHRPEIHHLGGMALHIALGSQQKIRS